MIEVVVEVVDHIDLFLDDLRKDPVLYCEQASGPQAILLLDLGLNAHPQWHTRHDLQHDTP